MTRKTFIEELLKAGADDSPVVFRHYGDEGIQFFKLIYHVGESDNFVPTIMIELG